MSIVLGCIADDLTGATDLAMILVREGMKTVQIVGVPDENTPVPDADAIVVALKSRTNPASEAVEMSLASCDWLQKAGAKQIFFKYCSTFDSTSDGNIGPVCDALMDKLDCPVTIACPSFPENGRTVYRGYLFVNDGLLSESSLRNHPLTPMHDSNLRRVLAGQSKATVSNIFFEDVEKGSSAIATLLRMKNAERQIHIVDAMTDVHLKSIGTACVGLPLVTGGSAVAQGLPDNFRKAGLVPEGGISGSFHAPESPSIVLSGSCSDTTLGQVAYAKQHMPSFKVEALDILDGRPVKDDAVSWAEKYLRMGQSVLFYSSADPASVALIQEEQGRLEIGSRIEKVLGDIGSHLMEIGVRRFVVAGGETSGAVIKALNVKIMEIGPQIDPGVPWTISVGETPLALALKSGNFGAEDFFIKAISQLNFVEEKMP
ncbi:MAG: 3-oxo-tetronate kinase [Sneathiella sp.]